MIAYWAGKFTNSFILDKMEVWMEGKHLWMRTIGSTIAGQGVDSVLFVTIALGGILPSDIILKAAVSGHLFKILYEGSYNPDYLCHCRVPEK